MDLRRPNPKWILQSFLLLLHITIIAISSYRSCERSLLHHIYPSVQASEYEMWMQIHANPSLLPETSICKPQSGKLLSLLVVYLRETEGEEKTTTTATTGDQEQQQPETVWSHPLLPFVQPILFLSYSCCCWSLSTIHFVSLWIYIHLLRK